MVGRSAWQDHAGGWIKWHIRWWDHMAGPSLAPGGWTSWCDQILRHALCNWRHVTGRKQDITSTAVVKPSAICFEAGPSKLRKLDWAEKIDLSYARTCYLHDYP